jgi:hypothetical protein
MKQIYKFSSSVESTSLQIVEDFDSATYCIIELHTKTKQKYKKKKKQYENGICARTNITYI